MIPRLLLLFALLVPSAMAQRVVVVDAGNGPGTTHTSLAPAFADLQDGDLLVLRAGTYDAVVVSTPHSFVLQGEGSPVVVPTASLSQAMEVYLWGGATQRLVIQGVTFQSERTGQWALTLATFSNAWPAPTVHLEDCVVASLSPQADRVALLAQSIGLTVQRCTLNTTQIVTSLATIVDSTIVGHDLSTYLGFEQRAQTALDVIRSKVWIVDSELRAGSSLGVYAEPAACLGFSDSSFTTGSVVHVCGDSSLQADAFPSPLWPVPSVLHNYAWFYPVQPNVQYEPTVVLTPSPAGPVFGGSILSTSRILPSQTASSAPIGGVFTTTTRGTPGDTAYVFLSFTTYAQRLGDWELILDESTMFLGAMGVLDASGAGALPIPIPNLPSLRGACLEIGAATMTPAGLIELTNPAVGIVR